MIKVSVLYLDRPDARFDQDYYRNSHMPMIQNRLGQACLYYTIEKGIAGMVAGSRPPFVAACHIYSETIDEFRYAILPYLAELEADVRNFTNLTSTIQFSEELFCSRPASN